MARGDAMSFGWIKSRYRYGPGFVRDIDHPHKSRRCRSALAGFFVGNDHHVAIHEFPWDRQGRVDRRGVGRRPVEATDKFWPRHVGDIEDHEAAVPVAGVEPITAPDRMVALVLGAFPGWCLA